MSKIYITGVSGTGKSALIEVLKKRRLNAIDIDETDLCGWKNNTNGISARYHVGAGEKWLDSHSYICESSKMKRLLRKFNGKHVIIAGVTSNQAEYLQYFDKIFLLRSSAKTLLHRLAHRNSNDFAKDKSEQLYLIKSKKKFEREMIKLGAVTVNSEKPIKKIAEIILSTI